MENKMDVKAMTARFQGSGPSVDAPSPPTAHIKPPLKPTYSTGLKTTPQKPALENRPPKPAFLKNAAPPKSDTAGPELNKTKMLANMFSNAQDDTNTKGSADNKHPSHFKPPPAQPPEPKVSAPKPPFNKPLCATQSDAKPTFPKPSLAAPSKPSWIKDDIGGGATSSPSTPPKPPPLQQKPASSLGKLWQQNQELSGPEVGAAHKPSPVPNTTIQPSNFRAAQNMFNKDNKTEQPDNHGVTKTPLSFSKSMPPERPPASKKPSLKKRPADSQHNGVNSDDTSEPKRNPLPNLLALGAPPAKPNRPPNVNLQNFKREAQDDGSGTLKKNTTLTPTSNPSNHGSPVTPHPPVPQAPLPSLPPGHPGAIIQQEDFYDDVEELSRVPPPLPPTGHPSQRAKEGSDDEDDGEMYEDLEDRWDAAEQKQEKKKEKDEKKRLENEKKEQKEREKKEHDAKKRFKLTCPIEIIQQGKACVDAKGSKTDLSLKIGESLDIIRVQGNPEGKWLARAKDGSIGYVKITSVTIDFDSLKTNQAQQKYNPDIYDDIDIPCFDNSGPKGGGVTLNPLPGGNDGEIYDDVADPSLEVNPLNSRSPSMKPHSFLRMFDRNARSFNIKVLPPTARFPPKGNTDSAVDDEIYDDVDSQSAPPLPPVSSLSALKGKCKPETLDPKKQKKLEKEEKEFRKKFKYEGEIQVLYQVTIIPTVANKKWGGNELSVKAGEKLDVIVDVKDNKLVCRNDEGKFGYVSTSNIVHDDGEIYDDIGDDCIYDND